MITFSAPTLSLVTSIHLALFLVITLAWNKIIPHPYMDEIFHIPQAQRYCSGDYWTWDPKLTTPPGLYVISNLLLAFNRPLCSTLLLRLTNLLYPLLSLFIIAALIKEFHPHTTYHEAIRTSSVIITFPILYFFNFLYYTDGGSAAFVLLAWLASKKRYHFLAAISSAIAITFRQTNIIWALFILGTALLNLSNQIERRQYDPKAAFVTSPSQLIQAIIGFISTTFKKLPTAIFISIPYLFLLTGFATFVKWNGGIVLGDRSNHVPTLHIVQLFYFVAFAAGMSVFSIIGVVPLARLLKKPNLRTALAIVGIAFTMAFCIYKFTIAHPFLLADNRHYTFYLWKAISKYNRVFLYALIPCYIAAASFCWQAIATEQTIIWMLIYIVATALTLIPSPLLEFRYFITPYLIYRIAMRQPRGVWLMLELLLYSLLNAFTIWMFMTKPFLWPHENGLQRFMW